MVRASYSGELSPPGVNNREVLVNPVVAIRARASAAVSRLPMNPAAPITATLAVSPAVRSARGTDVSMSSPLAGKGGEPGQQPPRVVVVDAGTAVVGQVGGVEALGAPGDRFGRGRAPVGTEEDLAVRHGGEQAG